MLEQTIKGIVNGIITTNVPYCACLKSRVSPSFSQRGLELLSQGIGKSRGVSQ